MLHIQISHVREENHEEDPAAGLFFHSPCQYVGHLAGICGINTGGSFRIECNGRDSAINRTLHRSIHERPDIVVVVIW